MINLFPRFDSSSFLLILLGGGGSGTAYLFLPYKYADPSVSKVRSRQFLTCFTFLFNVFSPSSLTGAGSCKGFEPVLDFHNFLSRYLLFLAFHAYVFLGNYLTVFVLIKNYGSRSK